MGRLFYVLCCAALVALIVTVAVQIQTVVQSEPVSDVAVSFPAARSGEAEDEDAAAKATAGMTRPQKEAFASVISSQSSQTVSSAHDNASKARASEAPGGSAVEPTSGSRGRVPAVADGQAGVVSFVKGRASAVRSGSAERILRMQSPVFPNDTIECDAGSRIEIRLTDGMTLWLGESSRLTLDEYVYRPGERPVGRCVLRLAGGFLRVVTAAIARISPEGFKVRTRMATTGIRGCDAGIVCDEKRTDVYAIALGEGEVVIVEATSDGSPVTDATTGRQLPVEEAKKKTVNVDRAGWRVTVIAGAGVEESKFEPEEIGRLVKKTSRPAAARYDMVQEPNGSVLLLRPGDAGAAGGRAPAQ